MTSKIRTVVVDDERPARRKILRFLEAEPSAELVGEAGSGPEAVEIIQRVKPDLVFLDIQMPGFDGFGVIGAIDVEPLPAFVFVTAFDQFALRAFEVHALDYLLKPFDLDQFQKAFGRVKKHLEMRKAGELSERLSKLLDEVRGAPRFAGRLLVSSAGRAFILEVDRVDRIESAKNYVALHVGGETHLLRGTIGGLYRKLDPEKFLRVSRSHIINVNFIKELHPWFHGEYHLVLKDGTEMTWSRRYLDRSADSFIRKF